MRTETWWKSTALLLAVAGTLAGATLMALQAPPKEPTLLYTTTRAS